MNEQVPGNPGLTLCSLALKLMQAAPGSRRGPFGLDGMLAPLPSVTSSIPSRHTRL